ncbi:hypothetical protein [Streptomyces sp. NPDC057545]|uniref:hypothetical protein n=1 Tax=unclassified Streptomyces TaxID=2593676 RepID=UPI0036C05977
MADTSLPKPDALPLTPDELKKRDLEWAESLYQAPPADSYADPTAPVPLQPTSPLRPQPPLLMPPGSPGTGGQGQGEQLRITPSVLNKAADRADEILTAFSQPAASLEAPVRAAVSALSDWQSARALREAHKRWEQQAGTVAAWLGHIAESLRAGARDYTKTDVAVDEAVRNVRSRRSLLEGL